MSRPRAWSRYVQALGKTAKPDAGLARLNPSFHLATSQWSHLSSGRAK